MLQLQGFIILALDKSCNSITKLLQCYAVCEYNFNIFANYRLYLLFLRYLLKSLIDVCFFFSFILRSNREAYTINTIRLITQHASLLRNHSRTRYASSFLYLISGIDFIIFRSLNLYRARHPRKHG